MGLRSLAKDISELFIVLGVGRRIVNLSNNPRKVRRNPVARKICLKLFRRQSFHLRRIEHIRESISPEMLQCTDIIGCGTPVSKQSNSNSLTDKFNKPQRLRCSIIHEPQEQHLPSPNSILLLSAL
jgi:hypothetical protein